MKDVNLRNKAGQAGGQAMRWVAMNPGTTAVCAFAAPAVLAAPALSATGFGIKGFAAGKALLGASSRFSCPNLEKTNAIGKTTMSLVSWYIG